MTDFDQTELPEGPTPVGRLYKLRALLPKADAIILHAKAVNVFEVDGKTKVPPEDVRAVASRRRALEKRLDALGVPRKTSLRVEWFPTGTQAAAEASGEFWAALEAAMSAVVGVHAAEEASVPRGRLGDERAGQEPPPAARAEPDPPGEHDNGPEDGYRCIYCGSNVNDWPDQPCVPR